MPNKKINQLDARTAVGTDLMLVGDPVNGTAYKSTLANLPLVPNSRTLTINGVPFDLSANRAWTLGTVTSVGLSMPSAFAVANSPITSSGTLAVTAIGTASQYIRGDGALETFPGTASGGSAVSYYLNGGTTASVATYFQMSKTAVLGAAADFNLVGNGLIAQFLTDVSDPNRLEIPAGNWNFELYFNISSSGGNTAFYVELLKYNGSTFTSIASSVATPEAITGGTLIDLYLTSLAIPQTTLLASDRLALRVYIVSNSGGRTVTLHTQNGHLCEIITNFSGGLAALNGLTTNTQYFATGTSGTNFNIVSSGDTHTFNLPTASATNRGALSSADWSTFNGKVPSSRTLTINGTAFDLSADRSWTIPSSNIYNADGTLTAARTLTHGGFNLSFVGSSFTNRFTSAGRLLLGTTTESTYLLDVNGTARVSENLTVDSTAIGTGGYSSKLIVRNTNDNESALYFPQYNVSSKGFDFSSSGDLINFRRVISGVPTTLISYTPTLFDCKISSFFRNSLTLSDYTIGTPRTRIYLRTIQGGYYIGYNSTNDIVSLSTQNDATARYVSLGGTDATDTTYTGVLNVRPNTGTVAIGVLNATASSLLDLQSTTKGFLPPRMTTTQKNAIATPAAGLQVYDSTLNQMSYYNGTTWVNF